MRSPLLFPFCGAILCLMLAPAPGRAQRDTIRAGVSPLANLVLPLGIDSSDTYAVRDGERRLVATYIEEITRTGDGYLVVGRNVRNGVILSLDSVGLASGSLAPLWHADTTRSGRLRVRFADNRMRGTRTDSAGAELAIDSAVPEKVFDYSVASRIINLLPLRAGYDVVMPSYDIHRGPQFTRVTVVAEEDLAIGGRAVPAWKVEVDYGRFKATRWIDRSTRQDLRTTVSGGGMEMIAEPRRHP
jgi:hypothetical protein